MAITSTDFKDGITFSGGGNGDTVVFALLGGRYNMAVAATWGGGNVDLQVLMPDGTTYVSVLSSTFTANSGKTLALNPGTYKVVITTASAAQGFVSPAPYRRA